MDNGIQRVSTSNTVLNAEHYRSFEMAKANDDVLANGTLKELINYQAQVRAMLEYTHKLVSTMSSWDEFTSSRAETVATEQAAANLNVYIDQRMGELVAALPKATGNQYQQGASLPAGNKAKGEVLKDAGLTPKTASQLEQLAKNPEVVEAVIAKATEEGRIVSRNQVLKAINAKEQAERDRRIAEQEAECAKRDAADAYRDAENLEAENDALRRKLAEKPEPKVVEREVERVVAPPDYEAMKRRVDELEQREKMRSDDNRSLRQQLDESNKELRKAREILGMDKNARDVGRDVRYLISATNSYIRTYGGLTWTVQQLEQVDEISRQELQKAAMNLATFASALVASLEQMK